MHMGAKIVHTDVRIAHMSVRTVTMDTKTSARGCPTFAATQNVRLAFVQVLSVYSFCCTCLSPTVSLAAFWTRMQQLADHYDGVIANLEPGKSTRH